MAATYPGGVKTWTPVQNNVNNVNADHVNGAYEEIIAIETEVNSHKANTTTAHGGKVSTTGNETIAGVKTFSSSPVVPTPTTDMQASTKKYTDDLNTSLTQIVSTIQAEVDVLVVDGDSSVEAAQARINADAVTFDTLQARLNDSDAKLKSKAHNTYSQKVHVCFGDSLTHLGTIPTKLEALLGATVHNVGFAGCQMGHNGGGNYELLSMAALAAAVATGNFTAQEATAIFPDQVAKLKALNFNDIDSITIAYGTNDFEGNRSIGKDTDTTPVTVKGAMNYIVNTLLTAFPHLQISFLTPIFRGRLSVGDGKNSDDYPNFAGKYLKDYVKAIQTLSTINKVRCIDLYSNCGINKHNSSVYLSDGLHPTTDGDTLIANAFYKGMQSTPTGTIDEFGSYSSEALTTDFYTLNTGVTSYAVDPIKFKWINSKTVLLKGTLVIAYNSATMNVAHYPLLTDLAFAGDSENQNVPVIENKNWSGTYTPEILILWADGKITIPTMASFINGQDIVLYFNNVLHVTQY